MGSDIEQGDRVYVTDPALAELRRIMRDATGEEPPPNHHGMVDRLEGDVVLINFDDGGCAPYPVHDVHKQRADPARVDDDQEHREVARRAREARAVGRTAPQQEQA